MSIIEANHLVKHYPLADTPGKTFAAVDDVSLKVEEGEIYGILGPNGAGKTTTLEMLEGLGDIDGGEAYIDGISVNREPYRVKKVIGVQLQANEYFDNLSLVELLKLFAGLYDQRGFDPMALLKLVDLEDKGKAKPQNLSGGQQQRFSVACALVNTPRVLFLDEPTTGLDPQARRNLWDLVRRLNGNGMTVVLTTHNMEEAEVLCRRLAIMDHGKIVAEGAPAELIQKYGKVPDPTPSRGNMEDVFLALTGHELRD